MKLFLERLRRLAGKGSFALWLHAIQICAENPAYSPGEKEGKDGGKTTHVNTNYIYISDGYKRKDEF